MFGEVNDDTVDDTVQSTSSLPCLRAFLRPLASARNSRANQSDSALRLPDKRAALQSPEIRGDVPRGMDNEVRVHQLPPRTTGQ